jgi:hypothetical protein
MYLLDVSNPKLLKWTKVEYDANSPVPTPRSYECSVYSAIDDAFYMYGGIVYTSNFSSIILFGDSWVFHFSTNTWTLLSQAATPGSRGGHGCVMDPSGQSVIVTHGVFSNVSLPANSTWKWHLPTNTWTQLNTPAVRPVGRWLFGFFRIPNTNNYILINGRNPFPPVFYFTDMWVLNGDSSHWTQFTVSNVPIPPREAPTQALLSSKWLIMSGGDADGNLTVADTCKPPLICRTAVANPQDTNFFLKIRLDQNTAEWEDEEEFDHTTTPHRHANVVSFKPYLYMYGGMDWDGQHGIGEISNTLTWGIKIKDKFWDD